MRTPFDLESLQEQNPIELLTQNGYKLGHRIVVIRSNGQKDSGWRIDGISDDNSGYIARKIDENGQMLRRNVSLQEFTECNPNPPTTEPEDLNSILSTYGFELGDEISVERARGVDDGWRVDEIDEHGFLVVRKLEGGSNKKRRASIDEVIRLNTEWLKINANVRFASVTGEIYEGKIASLNYNSNTANLTVELNGCTYRVKSNYPIKGKLGLKRLNTAMDPATTLGDTTELMTNNLFSMTNFRDTEIVAGSDIGYNYGKPKNEDRVVVANYGDTLAVIDGMGGYGDGDKAAQCLADSILETPTDIRTATVRAKTKISTSNLAPKAGCVYAGIRRISTNTIEIFHAGDARVTIIDQNGNIVFQTVDHTRVANLVKNGILTEEQASRHSSRNQVNNALSASSPSSPEITIFRILKGYRAYIYSDGVGDNLTPNEITSNTRHFSATEAVRYIDDITATRMINVDSMAEPMTGQPYQDGFYSEPKPDNRAIIVVDF